MSSLKPEHIGEELFAYLINKDSLFKECLCKKLGLNGQKILGAQTETKIYRNRQGKSDFDGKSRIDVALKLSNNKILPVELKLGKTRMAPTGKGFGRFLGGYSLDSHEPRRISGSMVSILSRKSSPKLISKINALWADYETERLEVCDKWVLVVLSNAFRDKFEKFEKFEKPENKLWSVNEIRPVILSFQELFSDFRQKINDAVEKIIKLEPGKYYYDEWFGINSSCDESG